MFRWPGAQFDKPKFPTTRRWTLTLLAGNGCDTSDDVGPSVSVGATLCYPVLVGHAQFASRNARDVGYSLRDFCCLHLIPVRLTQQHRVDQSTVSIDTALVLFHDPSVAGWFFYGEAMTRVYGGTNGSTEPIG